MYKDYFRLKEMPFSIAPDPRFLFMSDRHREAIAHLLYGVQGEGGIVLLTGEVGTGKTTICRSLLEQLPENIDVAFILNPRMNVEELLKTVCEEFHIPLAPGSAGVKAYVDVIHGRLLEANAKGRRAILIVDEAQNLDPLVLEQLRLLTNLETNTRKLLQIFLIGQPELQDMLGKPEMRQVAQRVVARYHLSQLRPSEVHAYVAHRLRVSGAPPGIFPDTLMTQLYRASGGVPRLINLVCDRALLGTYVQGQPHVTARILRQAVSEVVAARRGRPYRWAVVSAVVALLGAVVLESTGLAGAFASRTVTGARSLGAAPAVQRGGALPGLPSPVAGLEPAHAPLTVASVTWPGNVAMEKSDEMAFQSLFRLYGMNVDARSGREPCQAAQSSGMRCYSGRGGLADLLLLDRPAVLRMSSAEGRPYSVTLIKLDREHQLASLSVAGGQRRVSLNELATSWSGKYVVIWKAPPGFGERLVMNQRGPAVAWLRQTMARVDGMRDDGAARLDRELARRIRAFQLTEGIRPDGVVGPLTAIRLGVRSGQGGPNLALGKEG